MAALDEPLDFATLAIAHKLVTREQVEEARLALEKEQAAGQSSRKIEDVLMEKGYVRAEAVWAVTKARERLERDAKTTGHRIGGYEILGTLGSGGLGVVYKARQISMGRIVALKVLHQKWVDDDEFRKRFLVEARLVGRLSHQNLIQVFDVGRYKDTLYYSMEYVDGETVEDKIERDGRMELPEILNIIFQVTRALQYLYKQKIVHRDIKPGNIMMTRQGVAKLGDFGFVKSSLDSVISTEGEVLGTPDYISPEAAMGAKDLDFRSDLYSLGASMYHMLSGRPPFGGTGSAVMEAHIREEIPPIRNLVSDLPERAVRLIETLMAKNRDNRHQSFGELFEELELLRLELSPRDAEGNDPRSSVMRFLARGGGKVDQLLEQEQALTRRVNILQWVLVANAMALLAALLTIVYLLLR